MTAELGLGIWDVGFKPISGRGVRGAASDEELVARARARDVVAFEELLGRHEERVFRLAMRFVHNSCDAQEILQEVSLAAWRKLPGFEGRAQISSWLYRVTHNASLMFLRTRHRHPETAMEDVAPAMLSDLVLESSSGPHRSPDPDEQMQSRELMRQIQKAIDRLPVGLRTVFLVREVEGLSAARTAQSLGLSLPAVKTRLHRARRALRAEMSDYLAA